MTGVLRTVQWYSDEMMGSLDGRLGGGKKMNDSELLESFDSAAHVEIILVTEAILRRLRVLHCMAVEETLKTMPKDATIRNFANVVAERIARALAAGDTQSSSGSTLKNAG